MYFATEGYIYGFAVMRFYGFAEVCEAYYCIFRKTVKSQKNGCTEIWEAYCYLP